MLEKLNAIEQKMKSPEVKVKIIRVGSGVVSFLATAVIAQLVDTAVTKGADALINKINNSTNQSA
jgi:hypothetical protein